jgi:hypothetical protein
LERLTYDYLVYQRLGAWQVGRPDQESSISRSICSILGFSLDQNKLLSKDVPR